MRNFSFLIFLVVLCPVVAGADPCRGIFTRVAHAITFWVDRSPSPVQAAREAEYSAGLERRIQRWQQIAGRTVSERDVKRARMATKVLTSLKFDRIHTTADMLKPLFMEVQLAFHMIRYNEVLRRELAERLTAFHADPATELPTLRKWLEKSNIVDKQMDRAIASGDPAQVLDAARALEASLVAHTRRMENLIALKYDEYDAARSMLEACARHDDDVAKNAKTVLERLESTKILPNFFKKIGSLESDTLRLTPTSKDLKALLDSNLELSDKRRRWYGNRERFAAILAFAPTDNILGFMDRIAAKLPWINSPKVRAFLQLLRSERSVVIYYPDIQRILQGDKEPAKKLVMMEMLNAGTDDNMIVTFARRIDARDAWNDMKKAAAEREDKDFHNRMIEAEKARKVLGELVLWNHPGISKGVRLFCDAVIFSGFGYLIHQGASAYLPSYADLFGADDDDKKDKTTVPDVAPPADEEEIGAILRDVDEVFKAMEADPEGKKLWDEVRANQRAAGF